MERKNTIIQPNHIITARYNLSAIQTNIIISIIDGLQYKMKKDINQEYKEQKVTLEIKTLDKNNNYKRIFKAVKSLGSKHVEYNYVLPGTGKISATTTSLVSGVSHVKNSSYITLLIPSDAYRFFSYIGGGFTSYQKTIAISLNSIYSKKFYFLCRRWLDKGGYSTTIETLRIEINIVDKYKKISHLKSKVLQVAEKELKEKADVFFTYSFIKTGRKYTGIRLKIFTNKLVQEKYNGIKNDNYISVYNFLNIFFPNHKNDKALYYSDQLAIKKNINEANSRFKRLTIEYKSGNKKKKDIINLLTYVILPEFGVKVI